MSTPKLPEGSRTLSLLQKLQWITKPLEILETHAQIYGDIFTFPVGPSGIPQVVISNPQGIQKIFTADLKQLDSGKEAGIKPLFVGDRSLLALSGERHKRERKLLMPPFHGERMRAYGELIRDLTEQVTSQFSICLLLVL